MACLSCRNGERTEYSNYYCLHPHRSQLLPSTYHTYLKCSVKLLARPTAAGVGLSDACATFVDIYTGDYYPIALHRESLALRSPIIRRLYRPKSHHSRLQTPDSRLQSQSASCFHGITLYTQDQLLFCWAQSQQIACTRFESPMRFPNPICLAVFHSPHSSAGKRTQQMSRPTPLLPQLFLITGLMAHADFYPSPSKPEVIRDV